MSAIPTDVRVTQSRVFLSEWTKLRSLRSTKIVLLVAIVLTIGFSALYSTVIVHQWSHMRLGEKASFSAINAALVGAAIAQLAIGVLGVLSISGEYSTGMIRSSFSAVPKRLPVLWAKVGVYGVVTLVLMIPTILVAFFLSQGILSIGASATVHQPIAFTHAGVARVLFGGAAYLTVMGIFALGLGAITRGAAAGIGAFVGIILILPGLLQLLPSSWNHAVSPYLPANAGEQIMALTRDSNSLSPWVGFAVLCGWTAGRGGRCP